MSLISQPARQVQVMVGNGAGHGSKAARAAYPKDSVFYLESCPSPKMVVTACGTACFPVITDSIITRKVKGVISVCQMLCRVPNQSCTCRSRCLSQSATWEGLPWA